MARIRLVWNSGLGGRLEADAEVIHPQNLVVMANYSNIDANLFEVKVVEFADERLGSFGPLQLVDVINLDTDESLPDILEELADSDELLDTVLELV